MMLLLSLLWLSIMLLWLVQWLAEDEENRLTSVGLLPPPPQTDALADRGVETTRLQQQVMMMTTRMQIKWRWRSARQWRRGDGGAT
jgi:hypothetical protein